MLFFPSLPPSSLELLHLPRMATASLWGCKATTPGSARQEMRTEGARKCRGPGASATGGAEQRGTGCSTGSAQPEEAAAPTVCAKSPGETSDFPTPPERLRQHMPQKAGKERRAQPELCPSPQRCPGLQVLTSSSTVDAGAWARLNHNHFL